MIVQRVVFPLMEQSGLNISLLPVWVVTEKVREPLAWAVHHSAVIEGQKKEAKLSLFGSDIESDPGVINQFDQLQLTKEAYCDGCRVLSFACTQPWINFQNDLFYRLIVIYRYFILDLSVEPLLQPKHQHGSQSVRCYDANAFPLVCRWTSCTLAAPQRA